MESAKIVTEDFRTNKSAWANHEAVCLALDGPKVSEGRRGKILFRQNYSHGLFWMLLLKRQENDVDDEEASFEKG